MKGHSTPRAIVLLSTTLLFVGCSDKKEVFKEKISDWLGNNPRQAEYCTGFKVKSYDPGNTVDMIGGTPLNFFEPSPALTANTAQPIFAILAEGSAPPGLDAMIKTGVLSKQGLTLVTDKLFYGINIVHHYTESKMTAYVLTRTEGFQIDSDDYGVGGLPPDMGRAPRVSTIKIPTVQVGGMAMMNTFCGGKLTVGQIDEYTIPTATPVGNMSTVKATLNLNGLPDWLKNQDVAAILSTAPKSSYPAQAAFVQTSNGWDLASGVQINGIRSGF